MSTDTHVSYSTVGCFITADEKKELIMKCLHHHKQWNKNWYQELFKTDFDTSEKSAMEETLPGMI